MSYDDQYDKPLSGPERVRMRALELTQLPGGQDPTEWVESARELERYMIGDRAQNVQSQIDDAYNRTERLLAKAARTVDPWETSPETVPANLEALRELVKVLSGLAELPF